MAPRQTSLQSIALTAAQMRKNINAGVYPSVCIFYGPDEFMKDKAISALREALLPGGLEDLNDITLENASAQQILEAAETLPVMCDRRTIVVREWTPLKTKSDAELKKLLSWAENAPESCTLIFRMQDEWDTKKISPELIDLVQRGKITAVFFDNLSPSEMLKWVNSILKQDKKHMSADAVGLLSLMAGNDLNRLRLEVDKLALYAENREEITTDDVRAIVAGTPDYNIFALIGTLLGGDLVGAENTVNALLQSGEKSAGIVSLMSAQMRRAVLMREGVEKTRDVLGVGSWLGLYAYPAKETERSNRRHSSGVLKKCYALCVEADYSIKGGKVRENEALKLLLVKIATICADSSSIYRKGGL